VVNILVQTLWTMRWIEHKSILAKNTTIRNDHTEVETCLIVTSDVDQSSSAHLSTRCARSSAFPRCPENVYYQIHRKRPMISRTTRPHTFFLGCVTLLTRFLLLMVSVFKFNGLARPCSLRKSPQALQSVAPNSFLRHSGVVEVPQF
jgi:hypothetical protein